MITSDKDSFSSSTSKILELCILVYKDINNIRNSAQKIFFLHVLIMNTQYTLSKEDEKMSPFKNESILPGKLFRVGGLSSSRLTVKSLVVKNESILPGKLFSVGGLSSSRLTVKS